ncbi:hypothetical protein MVEN_01288100 [Mycena venus]|uniref:Uncharacterized protein n=1 Tax=Mycena venus TaxID=2733690 RepID=A0A8H6Y0E4_9AGAR|nr:hypothetical protein MVEN_01288100 [Mycena venus]
MAKEKGTMTHAFGDTAQRLGPVSQVVIGLGASWISRTFGLGQVIVILPDSRGMHDLFINRATGFYRSKLVNNLHNSSGYACLSPDQQFKYHKRYLGNTMTNLYIARMTPRIMDRMQELVDLWSAAAKRLCG